MPRPATIRSTNRCQDPRGAFPGTGRDDCTDMTTIGFLGSGNLGGDCGPLASAAADIDHDTRTVPDFADAVRRHEVIAAIERAAASGDRVKL